MFILLLSSSINTVDTATDIHTASAGVGEQASLAGDEKTAARAAIQSKLAQIANARAVDNIKLTFSMMEKDNSILS